MSPVVATLLSAVLFGMTTPLAKLLLEGAASGAPSLGAPTDPGAGQVRQGLVEVSNVDAVTEITSLIQAQRAYEMNARVITAADEMLATSSNLR